MVNIKYRVTGILGAMAFFLVQLHQVHIVDGIFPA